MDAEFGIRGYKNPISWELAPGEQYGAADAGHSRTKDFVKNEITFNFGNQGGERETEYRVFHLTQNNGEDTVIRNLSFQFNDNREMYSPSLEKTVQQVLSDMGRQDCLVKMTTIDPSFVNKKMICKISRDENYFISVNGPAYETTLYEGSTDHKYALSSISISHSANGKRDFVYELVFYHDTGKISNLNYTKYSVISNVNFDYDITSLIKPNENAEYHPLVTDTSMGYTGMGEIDGVWYYFVNGEIDWNYTGMACNEYGWWYYNNGQLDWTYTGPAQNEYGNWWFQDGQLVGVM